MIENKCNSPSLIEKKNLFLAPALTIRNPTMESEHQTPESR